MSAVVLQALGEGGYMVLGVIFFVIMGLVLYKMGISKRKTL
jgi:hypothetical protein